MAYDGTDNFSQWDVTRPAGTEIGDVLGIALQEVKRITQAVVELEHNSDGTHQNGSIIQAYLADAAVGTDQLADGAVTAAKLATGIVSGSIIADGAVGTTQIEDAAVTTAKIANLAIGTALIAGAAVTPAKMGGATANQILVGQTGGAWNAVTLSGGATIDNTGVLTIVNPIAVDVAILQDIKADGTDGGTFTSGALQTRDLNSLNDPASFVALSGNKFTIPVGKYIIWAEVPAYLVGDHQAVLYDETNAVIKFSGSSSSNASTDLHTSRSVITGYLDLSSAGAPTQFSIKHQCSTTEATDGFGKHSSFTVAQEVYTQVMLFKVA